MPCKRNVNSLVNISCLIVDKEKIHTKTQFSKKNPEMNNFMQKCCPKGFISGKGNTTGIRPWTQEKYYHMRVLLTEEVSFEWSRHRISYTDREK